MLMLHTNVFTPMDSPVTPEVGLPGAVTEALPAITVQAPVPTVGVLPASVAVVPQTVWSDPAFDVVGVSSRVMFTVSRVVGQTPLVIIHSNKFEPTLNPVTPEVGELGVVTVAPPERTVHAPEPGDGVLPASVAVVEQTV